MYGNIRQWFPKFSQSVPSDLLVDMLEYWKFDADFVGEFGATTTSSTGITIDAGGKINSAARCVTDGALQYNLQGTKYDFSDGTNDIPFSISLWFYVESFSSIGNWFFVKRSGTAANQYQFLIIDGTLRISLFSNGVSTAEIRCQGTTSPALNTWYHVVFTYDGSKNQSGLNIYLNSVLESSTKSVVGTYTGMIQATAEPRFFKYLTVAGSIHKGFIDEVGIWKDRVLTQSEINALYNGGAGLQYPF